MFTVCGWVCAGGDWVNRKANFLTFDNGAGLTRENENGNNKSFITPTLNVCN